MNEEHVRLRFGHRGDSPAHLDVFSVVVLECWALGVSCGIGGLVGGWDVWFCGIWIWDALDWGALDWGALDWGALDWGALDWGALDWGVCDPGSRKSTLMV